MKKLLIALMLFTGVQLSAQTKEVSDALKAYERAKERSEQPKRATSPKTWLDLAAAYTSVYDAPINSIWLGASQMEIKVLLSNQRIEKSEEVVINNTPFFADFYTDKVLYYSQSGELNAWKVTKIYLDEPLLENSYASLQKAVELDDKGSNSKQVVAQLEGLVTRFFNEAMSRYALGEYKDASYYFERSANASSHELLGQVDTFLIYYTGLTAFMDQNYDRAIEFFDTVLEYDYDANGDVYSYLAESYKAKGQIDKTKEILNRGFMKYPGTQSILVSLINTYQESDEDPNKILELIHHAQKNEPDNATLYYAEGNVWKSLGKLDEAVKRYEKSIETDPEYYFGYFAIGAALYDNAVELQALAANEMDDTKYEAMLVELEGNLESAIEPFEKCFAASDDPEIKSVVAEYLKNIYFRFREKNEDYMTGFEKYDAYSKGKIE